MLTVIVNQRYCYVLHLKRKLSLMSQTPSIRAFYFCVIVKDVTDEVATLPVNRMPGILACAV
jgi:hypothetical protein